MTNKYEIENFSSWIIPSGEGSVYMEGKPTEEERAQDRTNTAKLRKNWHPSQEALDIFKRLVLLQGSWVEIQLWDVFMLWDEREGTNPFACNLLNVYTKTVKEKDREFIQLFVDFKDYKIIPAGNIGGSPIFERNLDPKTGIYTYNCGGFYSVSKDYSGNQHSSIDSLKSHLSEELLVILNPNISTDIKSISLKYDELNTFQGLLNKLFNTVLAKKVNPFSYGNEWIITKHDGHHIDKIGTINGDDYRPLTSAGINKKDIIQIERILK